MQIKNSPSWAKSNLTWLIGQCSNYLIKASALIALVLFSFSHPGSYEIKKSTAEVINMEGLNVFTDCKPLSTYDYLGTVSSNTGGFGNSQYEGVRSRLIKKVKKQFPEADGIIIYANSGQVDKADAIKFK